MMQHPAAHVKGGQKVYLFIKIFIVPTSLPLPEKLPRAAAACSICSRGCALAMRRLVNGLEGRDELQARQSSSAVL